MTIHVGVVGLGLGMNHVRTLQKLSEQMKLTAVCDSNEDRLHSVQGDVSKFKDFEEFLQIPSLDAIVLAVPHVFHAEMTIKALKQGKHVLVEKPMAIHEDECRKMNEEAKLHKRTLMIAQNWRFTPWCLEIKKIVDSGELGNLRMVRSDWLLNFHDFYPKGHWIYDGSIAGGGAIISLVVHNLDYLRFLFGEVRAVFANQLYTDDWSKNDAEDFSMVQMEFESGLIGQLMTSCSPFMNEESSMLQIYGDQGVLRMAETLQVSSNKRTDVSLVNKRSYDQVEVSKDWGDFGMNQMLHFAECIQTGKSPISGGEDNIHTVRLVRAIYESARTKNKVTFCETEG